MLNMNRATVLGHAGRDPEIRVLKERRQGGGLHARHHREVRRPGRAPPPRPARSARTPSGTGSWSTAGRRGSGEDAPQGRRGAGRGQDRHARISRQGRQRPRRHRNRRRRLAGLGQHPVGTGARALIPAQGTGQVAVRPRRTPRQRTPDRCPGRASKHEPARRSVGGAGLADRPVVGRGVGPVLHRALREPDLGRVLGVPVPISIGPISMGSAAGRAGHAPTRDRRSASAARRSAHRPLARGLGTGRLMDVSRKPWCFPNLGGLTIDPGPARWQEARPGLPEATAPPLGLACALLLLSAAQLDRGAARSCLPGRRLARHRLDLGTGPGLARRRAVVPAQPGSRAVRQPAGAGGLRRRLRRGLGRPAPGTDSSGAPAARAGCIR